MKKILSVLIILLLSTNVVLAQPNNEDEQIVVDNETINEIELNDHQDNLVIDEEEVLEAIEVETLETVAEDHDIQEVQETEIKNELENQSAQTFNSEFVETDWDYTISDDKVILKSYKGSDTDLIIPGQVDIDGETYNVQLSYFFSIRQIAGLQSVTVLETNNQKVTVEIQPSLLTYSLSQKFSDNPTVTKLDLKGLDVSQVTDFSNVFSGDKSLTDLDISGWDTSKARTTSRMLANTPSLTALDLSQFDVSNVNTASNMFDKSGIEELDLSMWDTKNFVRVSAMFYEMPNLRSLDVSGWDMTNTQGFGFMFKGLEQLESIDLSTWNIAGTQELDYLFYEATGLKHIDLSGWDTSSVTTLMSAFSGTTNLETINLEGWDVSNVQVIQGLFQDSGIEHVDLSSWNTENVIFAANLFRDAKNIKSTGIENWDVRNLQSLVRAFSGTEALEELDLSNWQTDSLKGIAGTFENATGLKKLNIDGFKFDVDANIQNAFANTDNLKVIDLSKVDLSNVVNYTDLFKSDTPDTELLVISGQQEIIDYDFDTSNRIPAQSGIIFDADTGEFLDGTNTKNLSNKHNAFVLSNRYLTQADFDAYVIEEPTHATETFVGWTPELNTLTFPIDLTEEAIVLKANYTADVPVTMYTVRIDVDGVVTELLVEEGSLIQESELPSLTKAGYTFAGFKIKDSDPIVMFDYKTAAVNQDLDLVAVFTANPVTPDPVKPTPPTGIAMNQSTFIMISLGAIGLLFILNKKKKHI